MLLIWPVEREKKEHTIKENKKKRLVVSWIQWELVNIICGFVDVRANLFLKIQLNAKSQTDC